MKPSFEKVNYSISNSFKLEELDYPHFPAPWHFHPEYELVHIKESTGKRFVGDHVENFTGGDLVFIGSNLPHVWLNDKTYYETESRKKARATVIQFKETYIPRQSLDLPELKYVQNALNNACRGINIKGENAKSIIQHIKHLSESEGIERFNLLFLILDVIGRNDKNIMLVSEGYVNSYNLKMPDKLKKVIHFVNVHYRSRIHMADIADLAFMNKSAFCRYFKEKTGKTFSKYINELRISYACKLLIDNGFSVSQVCYESGFNNLSNFNRQFKSITSYTPVEYKNRFSMLP